MSVKVRMFIPGVSPESNAAAGARDDAILGSGILMEDDLAVFPDAAAILKRGGPFVIVVDHEGEFVKEWILGRSEESYTGHFGFVGTFRMAKPTVLFTAPDPGEIRRFVDSASFEGQLVEQVEAASGPSPEVAIALAAGANRVVEVEEDPDIRGGICDWVPWC